MKQVTSRMKDGGYRQLKSHVPADVSAFTRAKSQPTQLVVDVKTRDQTWHDVNIKLKLLINSRNI